MNILVLGGTLFAGRHLVEIALDRGYQVTLFNRGQTNPDLFPQVETIIGDRDGGLEGGITTGQPLIVRAAMKPIATTLTSQQTVNLETGEQVPTQYERSDFCPVPRAVPIVEAMISFVLADALIEKLGGDSLDEMKPRFEALPGTNLSDINLDGEEQTWWPG